MATYVIGDVQGCFRQLESLLDKLSFQPQRDTLWFVGDLVNRGPNSLAVLRFVKNLKSSAITVLGNHDLHLLAVANQVRQPSQGDTLNEVLQAPDRDELLAWLRQQPLFHYDDTLKTSLVHAGIHPLWDLTTAQRCATEVATELQGENYLALLEAMYANQPDQWSEDLAGLPRWRFIINAFTRMRFCDTEGRLLLEPKGKPEQQTEDHIPWFKHSQRKTQNNKLVFGHWAALEGYWDDPNCIGLDTGCIWGGPLTALCLETGVFTSISSP